VLVRALREHRKRRFHIANPHGLVFTRDDGGPVDAKTDREAWTAQLDALGIARVDLHSARRTAAALLMAQGVDVKIIQAIMGHTTATTTQIYQHADQTMTRAALESLADSLG
jgi:integrase